MEKNNNNNNNKEDWILGGFDLFFLLFYFYFFGYIYGNLKFWGVWVHFLGGVLRWPTTWCPSVEIASYLCPHFSRREGITSKNNESILFTILLSFSQKCPLLLTMILLPKSCDTFQPPLFLCSLSTFATQPFTIPNFCFVLENKSF